MKKVSINSPEYRAIVTNLLGREVVFEDVPEIPVARSPPSRPRKTATPLHFKSAPPQKKRSKSKERQ